MSPKRVVIPTGREKPSGVWSPAVIAEAGKLMFISGITSRDARGNVVGVGDVRAQTRRVISNLRTTIEAAGGTLADIVSVTVFVTDIQDFEAIHEVRREFFPVEPPASTMVEISRLVDERSLIEISAIGLIAD